LEGFCAAFGAEIRIIRDLCTTFCTVNHTSTPITMHVPI
jgi:hypothetical protein